MTEVEREDPLEERWKDLFFGVQRSVRYHNARRGFYDRLHVIASSAGVIFGSAAFVSSLEEIGAHVAVAPIAAAIVTVFATIDLVTGTTKKARLHEDLSRRFIGLEQSMVAVDNPSESDLRKLTIERLAIERDEPPPYRVLDLACHNELARAWGYDEGLYEIGAIKYALRNVLHFRTDRTPLIADKAN